jgi:hypothetical protein
MTYYPDSTTYSFLQHTVPAGTVTSTVGWLDGEHDFPKGVVTEEFLLALEHLCLQHPCARTRGWHSCELEHAGHRLEYPLRVTINDTDIALGSAEVRVVSHDGSWLIAPNLILHYVKDHSYLPPRAFIEAVLAHKQSEECES